MCAYFFSLVISSKPSIQVLCFCFATSYFSASCHWWCTFFAMLLFWSPRAHCASALSGLCWSKSMGAEHRLFKQVLPRLQIPEWVRCPTWIFILLKVPYVCWTPHIQNMHRRKKNPNRNTGCIMTALSHFHYSRKAAAAAAAVAEGNIGLASKRSFDLLLLPLHFSIHWTVPAGRIHTELHVGSYAERHTCQKGLCSLLQLREENKKQFCSLETF